ncbi:hypothetical protein CPHO_11515 [Corynebacterium phocae]|uniref:Uncharacterized protein n=1 Tax=Corynebacterium phocae TaxID=161895 RepID=A0A1L7D650_9CORY|nr:hypothetical protein [Corynebacterium phocae]APT93412.1 hypothetical protein CPHO_11515 [Corynebacterium phocae]KAA8721106.1 hypothetical protein F4V58_10990 [Corynebacterium phocae]
MNNTNSRLGAKFRTLGVLGGTAFLASSMAPLALALPPGGAGDDTPGTYSSVSPSEVEQCGYLDFEVGGFPAGEIVNIKIDDGAGFGGDMSVQGQGVVARHKINSDGTASGSIEVPCDLPPGQHHLRYLATEGERNLGYTNRGGSNFTVIKAANDSADNSGGGSNSGDSDSDSNSNSGTTSTGTDSNRGGSRVVSNRGSGNSNRNSNRSNSGSRQQEEEIVEEVIYVEEGGQNQARSQSIGNSGGSNSSGGSANKQGAKKESLDDSVAKPKIADSKSSKSKTTSTATAANSGIFDKDKDKPKDDDSVLAADSSGPNSTPYVGLFVGFAILLVGMTAINAWLLMQRRK